jgi:hypothetical protein
MDVPKVSRRPARAGAAWACAVAVAAGLAVAGCADPAPAGGQVSAGLVSVGLIGAHPGPQGTGPAPGQISRFRWSGLPASPLGSRSQPLLVWAGGELIELGGQHKGNVGYDGAAFRPVTGRWHRIPSAAAHNVGFLNAVSVWTGRQLFVTNGQFESCLAPRGVGGTPSNCWPHAGLYDPATNRWSATRLPGPMDGLGLAAAVWTGHDVVLAGVSAQHGRLGVASYDPATGRWQMITPVRPAGHPSRSVAMVATAGRLIIWSLWDRVTRYKNGLSDRAGVDVLALGPGGTWRDVTGRWPQDQLVTSPVPAGAAILVSPGQVWCGTACSPPYSSLPGYFADPATLDRTVIPPGPIGETDPAFVWTGRAIVAVDRYARIGAHDHQGPTRPDDMALWDRTTGRWLRLPAPPGHPGLAGAPVWAGTELLALTATGQVLALRP